MHPATATHVHDEHAALGQHQFFHRDAMRQTLMKARFSTTRLCKGQGADDASRPPIRHAEDDLAATFVGQRHAVLDQLVEVEVVLGLLEFEPHALRLDQPLKELFS